ncbi:MAG: 50S ribosomal protein L19 [Clostridiaceae bacterium]|nr:50S ribosomal protein L19 [Clostridiales bacterium]NLB45623.1 50S ribosomal protein L19 [Clostridiaceae bacterium]
MNLIQAIESEQLKNAYPDVSIGDYVKVHLKIKEGNRERIQVFEGTVIARKGGGLSETLTVRRLSYGVGVERILPIHSPKIERIEIVRKGRVRRAKLYYLRDRVGKAAKVREKLANKSR